MVGRRWLCVAVVVVAACSSGGDTDDGAAGPDVNATSTTTTASTDPATTEPATTEPETTEPEVVDEVVRMNHIQAVGSHNSFHLLPPPALFDGIVALSPELGRDIEYTHRTLTEQLDDFGIRQFELDVFADPDGGLYASRAANAVVGLAPESGEPALDEPGFKVMHTQDFDYATTCLTLVGCLGEIGSWSAEHPNHLPIVILLELKSLSVPEAAAEEGLELTLDLPWAIPVDTTIDVLEALDAEVRSTLAPGQLLEPDEVRGDAATLVEAVEGIGWPALADSRGQIVVALNNSGAERDLFIADTPALEGRAMFTSSTPGAPDAAFLRFDDPNAPGLDAAAEAGYLMRTRTDSPTVDARENDTTDRDVALAGGATYLSTDYYEPSTLFDSTYFVELPGGVTARCNPVTAPPSCTPESVVE
ncbi:MAG: Ca2+-dependent phosphoinositide-specific phospholipase C [Ilumatobacter sp.]|uniref:Ca2+-dependent phosphoinositide-specific phospholipase C n=1 Tax=Ilumatobacter sp. TaxID=1967498 RepID=UPI003298E4DF